MRIDATAFHRSVHLAEEQLLAPSDACPFCGSVDRTNIASLQEEPGVSLLQCRDCNAASASRMPTPAALDDYYGRYYADKKSEQVTFDGTGRFSSHIANAVDMDSEGRDLRILDFGGGDGSISRAMTKRLMLRGMRSADILVVDYNNKTVPSTTALTYELPSEIRFRRIVKSFSTS